jgi:hypothetical protein
MSEVSESVASRPEKEPKDAADQVRLWLEAIDIASNEEETWRKRAQMAVNVYRTGQDEQIGIGKTPHTFNILHSNVETRAPVLYNSTPEPDVRRRHGDDDPVAEEVGDLLERCVSYSVDIYDFDNIMRLAVKDLELPGRGVDRARYKPYFDQEGNLADEQVLCEHVQWTNFRRGPGKTWPEVPWIAFRIYPDRDGLRKLCTDPQVAEKVPLEAELENYKDKGDGRNVNEIFQRATVWEIWDKDSREVIFIAEGYTEGPIRVEPDPLEIPEFFPIPRPLYGVETSDSLVPVVPYDVYRSQAEELEETSRRIIALTGMLQPKFVYDGRLTEMQRLVEAGDGDGIPIENATNYAEGGLERALTWWPIETFSKVLEKLYIQRDQCKQSIYEITGLADIMRGATDPDETATAQQIKSNSASLRIQRLQAEVERYARDLFELKANIIAKKFSWETIVRMSGIKYATQAEKQMLQQVAQQYQQQMQMAQQQGLPPPPPPASPEQMMQGKKLLERPSREEVEQLLRDDAVRSFRVDVESNSTIRADLTRRLTEMSTFMEGTGKFFQTLGPGVAEGFIEKELAAELYKAFASNFNLGKAAEDVIQRIADQARDNPQQQKEDPQVQIKREELKLKQQELQMKAQIEERKALLDEQVAVREMELKKQEAELKAKIAMFEAQQKAQLAQVESQQALQLKAQESAITMQTKQAEGEQKLQLAHVQAQQDQELRQQQAASDEMRKSLAAKNDEQRKNKMMQHKAKLSEGEVKSKEKRQKEPRLMKIVRDKAGKAQGAEIY